MIGNSVEGFTFRKVDQAVATGNKSTVKIKGDVVKLDPMLIFLIPITIGQKEDDLPSVLKYKLCSHPCII